MARLLVLLFIAAFVAMAQPQRFSSLSFRSIPLDQWLTAFNSNCIKLNCEVVSTGPWQIQYKLHGQLLDPQRHPRASGLPDGSLLICNGNPSVDSGTYRCEASTNTGLTAHKEITVNRQDFALTVVEQQSRVTILPIVVQQVTRFSSNCLEVTCIADGEPLPLTYVFSYNGVRAPSAGISVERNRLYNCGDLSRAGGVYNCTATNSLGRSSWRTISVRTSVDSPRQTQPPQPTTPPPPRVVVTSFVKRVVRSCLILECSASPVGASVNIQLNGRSAGSTPCHTASGPGQLQICSYDELNVGIAECTATYAGVRDQRPILVSRQDYPTRILPDTSNPILLTRTGQNCLTVSCYPAIHPCLETVSIISVNSNYGGVTARYTNRWNNSLEICDIDYVLDAGAYVCEAYNPRNTYTRTVTQSELRQLMSTGRIQAEECVSNIGSLLRSNIAEAQRSLITAQQRNAQLKEQLRSSESEYESLLLSQGRTVKSESSSQSKQADLRACQRSMAAVSGIVRPCA